MILRKIIKHIKEQNWGEVTTEMIVVIIGIFLALQADAWWENRKENDNVQASLSIIKQNLSDSVEQLKEFKSFSERAGSASTDAARRLFQFSAISLEERKTIERLLILSLNRRTMSLPRSGYTDLLNTGSLGKIENRKLRDLIIQYYEATERMEGIIEKNSALFNDGMIKDALLKSGLIVWVPRAQANQQLPIQVNINQILSNMLGDDFPTYEFPIWKLSTNDKELDIVKSALIQNARGAATAIHLTEEAITNAELLIRAIEDYEK